MCCQAPEPKSIGAGSIRSSVPRHLSALGSDKSAHRSQVGTPKYCVLFFHLPTQTDQQVGHRSEAFFRARRLSEKESTVDQSQSQAAAPALSHCQFDPQLKESIEERFFVFAHVDGVESDAFDDLLGRGAIVPRG